MNLNPEDAYSTRMNWNPEWHDHQNAPKLVRERNKMLEEALKKPKRGDGDREYVDANSVNAYSSLSRISLCDLCEQPYCNCGRKIEWDFKFCPICGQQVQFSKWIHYGCNKWSPRTSFCPDCGNNSLPF